VGGPRSWFHHLHSGGDELVYLAQVLQCLLAPLLDLSVKALQLRKQIVSVGVGFQRLDTGVRDRPAAYFGHPADRRRASAVPAQRGLPAIAAAIVQAQLARCQLNPTAQFLQHLGLWKLRPGVTQDLQNRLDQQAPPDLILSHGAGPFQVTG
jgi:hypothetical protein